MRLRYGPSPPTMVPMSVRCLFVLLFSVATLSCGGGAQDHPWNALDAERPIAAFDSVFIEELTWMEVRDRIADGATTAIVATGGIEQNGPYVVTGKHNVVLRATTEAIARRLGNALVAPIVKLVPEGDHDPPTGHMRFPGTFSLTPETFEMVLTDVARSLATSGFTDVLMIGDSGGNQRGMAAVAERWNAEPPHAGVRLHHILEYYREDIWSFEQLKELGVHQEPDVPIRVASRDPRRLSLRRDHGDRGPGNDPGARTSGGRPLRDQRRLARPARSDDCERAGDGRAPRGDYDRSVPEIPGAVDRRSQTGVSSTFRRRSSFETRQMRASR